VGFSRRDGDDPSISGWRIEAGPRLVHPYFSLEVDALVSSANAGTGFGWQVSVTATRPRPATVILMALLSLAMFDQSVGHDP
jgi:hypothetical protein